MELLRRAIYGAKKILHRNTSLYNVGYNLLTANRDSLTRIFNKSRYFSKFGGFWTDRTDTDFEEALRTRAIPEPMMESLRQWREKGIAIFPNAISNAAIDSFNAKLDSLPTSHPDGLCVTTYEAHDGLAYDPDLITCLLYTSPSPRDS